MTAEERLQKQKEKNAAYFRERFAQLEQARHRSASEVTEGLGELFEKAKAQIEADIARWYQRFADNNGLVDMAAAKRLLKSGELKELKWNVQQYIKAGRENGVSADWSKELENASARFHISRLEALELDLRNTVENLYAQEHSEAEKLLRETYKEGYYKSIFEIQKGLGIGFDVGAIDERALRLVLSTPWTAEGRNFSSTIWGNKDRLIRELRQTLARNIMLGKHPRECIREFAKKFDVAEQRAKTLIYTESAYVSAVAKGDVYDLLEVEEFQFIATLDERTSEICQNMDGEIFKYRDYQPGVNAEPMHPNCRSTTAPYYAELKGIGTRAARDPATGKTIHIPRDMKYKDWYETYVNGDGEEGSADGSAGDKGLASSGKSGIIKESIGVFRSLGAKATNFKVELPNGETVHITEGTRITNIKTIAGKGRDRQIDVINTLLDRWGGTAEEWQKKKGIGYIDYKGESYRVELHWYEEPTAGRHKWKVKPDADGNWFLED